MSDTPADTGPIEINTSEPEIVTTIDQQGDVEAKEPETPEPTEKPETDDKPVEEDPLRDDKGRFKGGVQGRIDELTRARREAERERDYYKGLATQNGAKPGDSAAPTAEPSPDDFEDYGAYVRAVTKWEIAESQKAQANARAEEASQQADQHKQAEWGAKVGAAKTIIADFDAVMEKADTPTAPHVAEAIMDADRGPELLYHLAQNPDIVERLNGMSANRAAIELGRIEATLGDAAEPPKPRETKQSKAPAPITPVASGSTVSKDPSKMSMDEYTAWRKEQGIR